MNTTTDTTDRLTYWSRLVRAYTAGGTPEQVTKAAKIATETEAAGEPCGVWHAAWLARGGTGKCGCMKCAP
jgi:hypothetical protein